MGVILVAQLKDIWRATGIFKKPIDLLAAMARIFNRMKVLDVSGTEIGKLQDGTADGYGWNLILYESANSSFLATGIGAATVQISAGTLVVIHISATDESATSIAAADGILYREYTYGSGWGSWAIGSPSEAVTKRVFRRARITMTGGKISSIVNLSYGNLEVYDWEQPCDT